MACLRYRANLTRTRTRRVLQIFSLDFEYSILNLWSLASWEFKFRILSVGFMMQMLCLPVVGGVVLQQRDSRTFFCRHLTPKMLCAIMIFKVPAWLGRLKACCFTNLRLLWIEITNTRGTGQCPTLRPNSILEGAVWNSLFACLNFSIFTGNRPKKNSNSTQGFWSRFMCRFSEQIFRDFRANKTFTTYSSWSGGRAWEFKFESKFESLTPCWSFS